MPRNVEIKARLASIAAVWPRVAPLATEGPTPIAQDDTFFHCQQGRLKLRAFSSDDGELIFYQRADRLGPKESFYVRTPTRDPDGLRDALARAHGTIGRVRKQRTLFLVGRTRVHLDQVEGLGEYIELEVVLAEGESAEAGMREAESLMAAIGVDASQLVEGAYLDLLAERARA